MQKWEFECFVRWVFCDPPPIGSTGLGGWGTPLSRLNKKSAAEAVAKSGAEAAAELPHCVVAELGCDGREAAVWPGRGVAGRHPVGETRVREIDPFLLKPVHFTAIFCGFFNLCVGTGNFLGIFFDYFYFYSYFIVFIIHSLLLLFGFFFFAQGPPRSQADILVLDQRKRRRQLGPRECHAASALCPPRAVAAGRHPDGTARAPEAPAVPDRQQRAARRFFFSVWRPSSGGFDPR